MARHNRQKMGAGSIQASTQKQGKFLGTYEILGREVKRWPVLMLNGKEGGMTSPQWKLQRYAMLPELAGAAQL
jgi:hypothetical protein